MGTKGTEEQAYKKTLKFLETDLIELALKVRGKEWVSLNGAGAQLF